MKKILIVSAVIIFSLAAFGVTLGSVSLIPIGLAVYAAKDLIDG